MSSFSIDDVRETFGADISSVLGRIEEVGRALATHIAPGPDRGESASFGKLGDSFHTIYGTSMLVGAESMGSTAGRLEQLARASEAAVRRADEERARAREVTALCLESARAMRAMLALELDGQRDAAMLAAREFGRTRLAAAPFPIADPSSTAAAREAAHEFAFDDAQPDAGDGDIGGELRAVFGREARDTITAVESQLRQLADKPDDFAVASQIERAFHTLKGSAATAGLARAHGVAADLQERMARILEGDDEVDASLVATLAADARRILLLVSAPEDGAPSKPEEFAFEEEAAGEGSPRSMRAELLAIFHQEVTQSLPALRSNLKALSIDALDDASARNLERTYHTLKGAAATVGLEETSAIAEGIQKSLESALETAAAVSTSVLEQVVEQTHRMLQSAGLMGVTVSETSEATSADGAQKVFLIEARQICARALAVAGELGDASADRAREIRGELGKMFHRLKGSALLTTDRSVVIEAERLQRVCAIAPFPQVRADVTSAVGRIASRLALDLAPALPDPVPATPSAEFVREAVTLPEAELWDAFTQECAEVLDAIDKSALDLETTEQPRRVVETLLRLYHTLKGAVNTVGLGPTGRELHLVEDFLETLLQRPILPSPKNVATLLLSVQRDVRRQQRESTQGWVQVSLPALQASIARVLSGAHPAAEETDPSRRFARPSAAGDSAREAPSVGHSGREASVADGSERKFIRVATERLDALMNLAGELVVSRSRLMSRVGVLRGMQGELGRSSGRLLESVDRFREEHEFSMLGSRQVVHAAGARPALGVGDTMQGPGWTSFSELELDRYDDVNVLSRSLAEITHDVNELNVHLVRELAGFADDSDGFGAIVNGIQSEVTRARMVPLELVFGRLRLPVRDAAEREGKEVRVVTRGEEVSMDKTIADALLAPMLHLVRNAVVHGIESAEKRRLARKPAVGAVTLMAREESGQIVVEVEDDGGGLDLRALRARGVTMGLVAADTPDSHPSVKDLVFAAGLSTRATAGAVSGRGVGGDIVRRAVERLNGDIRVETTPGVGTRFTMSLPITLAITKALLVRNGGRVFAIPLHFCDRILDAEDAVQVESAGVRRIQLDGAYVSVSRMDQLLGGATTTPSRGPLIVLRLGDARRVVQFDAVVGQEEIVVKTLGELLTGHPLFAGVTIRGTGELALILDVPALLEATGGEPRAASSQGQAPLVVGSAQARRAAVVVGPAPALPVAGDTSKVRRRVRALFVDDSLSVRKVAEKTLGALGAEVALAVDGLDALAKLREQPFDIVFTDLEMPRMHGYDLIREIRFLPAYKDLPVVVVSSRSGQKHQEQARALGANDYLTKPFSAQVIESSIARWCPALVADGALHAPRNGQ